MQLMDVYLLVIGGAIALFALASIPFPRLLCSDSTRRELTERGREKPWLWHTRANVLFAGLAVAAAAFLPNETKLPVAIPLLAAAFVSGLVCNLVHLRRFSPRGQRLWDRENE